MAWQKKYLSQAEKSTDAKKATNRAVWYLSQRDYAATELYEKLCQYFSEQAAAAAMAKAAEYGYLDDARYARNKARSLLLTHKSRRVIQQTLSQKGLDRALIAETLAALYEPEDMAEETAQDPELENAVALIERRYARKLASGREDLLIAAMQRRGFSYTIIRAALAQVAGDMLYSY